MNGFSVISERYDNKTKMVSCKRMPYSHVKQLTLTTTTLAGFLSDIGQEGGLIIALDRVDSRYLDLAFLE